MRIWCMPCNDSTQKMSSTHRRTEFRECETNERNPNEKREFLLFSFSAPEWIGECYVVVVVVLIVCVLYVAKWICRERVHCVQSGFAQCCMRCKLKAEIAHFEIANQKREREGERGETYTRKQNWPRRSQCSLTDLPMAVAAAAATQQLQLNVLLYFAFRCRFHFLIAFAFAIYSILVRRASVFLFAFRWAVCVCRFLLLCAIVHSFRPERKKQKTNSPTNADDRCISALPSDRFAIAYVVMLVLVPLRYRNHHWVQFSATHHRPYHCGAIINWKEERMACVTGLRIDAIVFYESCTAWTVDRARFTQITCSN